MENFRASDIRVQDIDHCGIIAGIGDEMELVQQIDRKLGTHPQEIIIAILNHYQDYDTIICNT